MKYLFALYSVCVRRTRLKCAAAQQEERTLVGDAAKLRAR